MLPNSSLSVEILANPNRTKLKSQPYFNLMKPSIRRLEEHIIAYKNLMILQTTKMTSMCKYFLTTLTIVTLTWYAYLLIGSISGFSHLEAKFQNYFVSSKRREKKSNFHLFNITQQGESVSTYTYKDSMKVPSQV